MRVPEGRPHRWEAKRTTGSSAVEAPVIREELVASRHPMSSERRPPPHGRGRCRGSAWRTIPAYLITCLIRVPAPRITAAAHATVSGVVNMRRMRILVTGASGVLGRVTVPLLSERGHQLATPPSSQLDLFDVEQVREQSMTFTPCCTWPPASPLWIAGTFPVPGT